MAEALAKKKRVRGGHWASIKRLIQHVTDSMNDHGGDPMKNKCLTQLRLSVEEKLTTLKNLDSEILDILMEDDMLGEDAVAEEIEQADSIKESCLLRKFADVTPRLLAH